MYSETHNMIMNVTGAIENKLNISNIQVEKNKDDNYNIKIEDKRSCQSFDSQSNYSKQNEDNTNNIFNAMDNCFEQLNTSKSTKYEKIIDEPDLKNNYIKKIVKSNKIVDINTIMRESATFIDKIITNDSNKTFNITDHNYIMRQRLDSMKRSSVNNQINKNNWENKSQGDTYAFNRIMSDLTDSRTSIN